MGLTRYARAFNSQVGPESTWLYFNEPGLYVAGNALVANRAVYLRRMTPAVPISQVEVIVGIQSGNICVAAYAHNPATNRPGARLATSGSVACPAPGAAAIALGATVTPEWLGFSCDNGTTNMRCSSLGTLVATQGKGRSCYQETAFPLPNPAAPTAESMGTMVIMTGKP